MEFNSGFKGLSSFPIIINVIVGDAFLSHVFVNCGVKTGSEDEFVFFEIKYIIAPF